jgi:hypothetical protein
LVGVVVQVTSRPLVMASPPLPLPKLFFQPRPCCFDAARLRARGRRWGGVAGAVGLAEGVAAGDERDGLFVVHRHAAEGLADVARGGEGSGLPSGLRG